MRRETQFSDVDPSSDLAPSAAAAAPTARLAYRIGGIAVGLFAAPDMQLKLDRELEPFRIAPSAAAVDVRIDVDWVDHLATPVASPIFHSGGLWSLFEESGGFRFYFSTPFLGAAPYKAAWFDRDFRRGYVTLFRRYFDPRRAVNPLEYPLDELIAIHRLSRNEGLEVHAVGVVDASNRGHLFMGHSGAGKSTSARLWQKQPGVRVLSDDRIILRFDGGRVRMFGTPWHGDAGLALADSADLSAIYLLQHGNCNALTPLSVSRAAAELLARSFIPHHSSEGLKSTLRSLDRITSEIPCSLFQFVPDQSAVEIICNA
jgi:hypothetical protein